MFATHLRAGRAGRVRAGTCYHLFARRELQTMADQQLPEMLRCPLETVCLRIKTLRLGLIRDFLSKAIEPPSKEAVDHVISVLSGLNALESTDSVIEERLGNAKNGKNSTKGGSSHSEEEVVEALTPLGYHLSQLPVDPRIGKMMLFGAVFRCVEPTLIIAASLAFRSPFFSPIDKREEADLVKRSFDPFSDHFTLLKAYEGWWLARSKGRLAEREFLHDNFLSAATLCMIEKMKEQFKQLLKQIGFFDRKQERQYNENSTNLGVVKAILVAGLYPNVIKVENPIQIGSKSKGPPKPPKLKTRSVFWGADKDEVVDLHPSSVLFNKDSFPQPFLVYHEKVKTSKVFVRDATMISPLALLLFGGKVEIHHMRGEVTLDGWLLFKVVAQHAVLIGSLREKLMDVLGSKIAAPELDLFSDEAAGKVIKALGALMSDFESGEDRSRKLLMEQEQKALNYRRSTRKMDITVNKVSVAARAFSSELRDDVERKVPEREMMEMDIGGGSGTEHLEYAGRNMTVTSNFSSSSQPRIDDEDIFSRGHRPTMPQRVLSKTHQPHQTHQQNPTQSMQGVRMGLSPGFVPTAKPAPQPRPIPSHAPQQRTHTQPPQRHTYPSKGGLSADYVPVTKPRPSSDPATQSSDAFHHHNQKAHAVVSQSLAPSNTYTTMKPSAMAAPASKSLSRDVADDDDGDDDFLIFARPAHEKLPSSSSSSSSSFSFSSSSSTSRATSSSSRPSFRQNYERRKLERQGKK